MKTTLSVLAAIVMPGGFLILAVALATVLLARRVGTKTAVPAVAAN